LRSFPRQQLYRRIVDRRSRHLQDEWRRRQRLDLIKTFDPRERERVDYLSWMKSQIASNFKKFARLQETRRRKIRELETDLGSVCGSAG
jgi:hypothetical protein